MSVSPSQVTGTGDPDSLRIVTLLPAATEIVSALGAGRQIVGISHECDFPPSIRSRPALTATRVDPAASTHAVSAAVRSIIEDALSIFTVDAEALAAIRPDVIVTQDLCEVCAVSLDDVRSAVARIAHRDGVQIVSLQPMSLDDVLNDIERVAVAIGRPDRGRDLRAGMESRIHAVATRARDAAIRPRVLTVEWLEPIMLGGTWMPELVERAGGVPIGVEAGVLATTVSPEELPALEPDVVLIKPCGFGLQRALRERAVIERDILAHVPAGTAVYVTDGNAYFNRPGPRLVDSLEILAACTHPDRFPDFARAHAASLVALR